MKSLKKIAQGSIIVFYALIGLEIVIMISPFAVYFYSVYGPLLKGLYAFPLTSWLTGFFLPHAVFTHNWFLNLLTRGGRILFSLGLIAFLLHAFQIYYTKFRRRGLVRGGLYSVIRHPQYLFLGISGLGLMLFWPRFFILVVFITMVFIYYLLALSEEMRLERTYGDGYRAYKARTSMFLPGNPGGRIFSLLFGWTEKKGWALLALYVLALTGGIGSAFALREYSKSQIPVIFLKDKDTAAISVFPQSYERMRTLVEAVYGDERVVQTLSRLGGRGRVSYLAHIMPTNYRMQGLIADVGMRHRLGGFKSVLRFVFSSLMGGGHHGMMGDMGMDRVRVVFSKLALPDGGYVPSRRAMDFNVKRTPLLLVDLDTAEGNVVNFMETLPRHYWGDMPMPVF